jgi:hypothetical protein
LLNDKIAGWGFEGFVWMLCDMLGLILLPPVWNYLLLLDEGKTMHQLWSYFLKEYNKSY